MTKENRDQTQRVLKVYERFAHRYDRSVRFWERVLGLDEGRRWIASRARGEVLEIAIGTGRNLPYYPADARVTGIDLSPAMLDQTRRRLRELGRDADLRVGDAQALDLPDESFDTVVITLALCSVPDERRALAEAFRVLRPEGRLLLLEHARSPAPIVRAGQRLVEPLFLWLAADHLLRDPPRPSRIGGLRRGSGRALPLGHRRAGGGAEAYPRLHRRLVATLRHGVVESEAVAVHRRGTEVREVPESRGRPRARVRSKRRDKAREARARETQGMQKQAEDKSMTLGSYRRRRVLGWGLAGLGVVVFIQHLMSHMGFFTLISPGWDDLVAGYPLALLLGVAGAVILSKT